MTLGNRAGALLLVAVVLAALAAGLAAPAGASAADTTPPAASASLPAYVTASGVTVTVVASDPESGIVDARLSNEGAAWSEWLVLPDPDPTSGETTARLAWDVGATTGDKTVYVEVRNGEGLTTQVTASTRLLLATDLTVHAVPPVVVFGTSGELRGVVANSSTVAGSVELSLDAKPETGGDFSRVTSFMSQGWALRTAVSPAVNTIYRVSYAGDGGLEAPASTEVLVRVRPRITTDFPRSFWLGKTVRLKGRVVPAHPGSQVTIERKSGGVWGDFTTVTLDEASSFNVPFKPTRPGLQVLPHQDGGRRRARARHHHVAAHRRQQPEPARRPARVSPLHRDRLLQVQVLLLRARAACPELALRARQVLDADAPGPLQDLREAGGPGLVHGPLQAAATTARSASTAPASRGCSTTSRGRTRTAARASPTRRSPGCTSASPSGRRCGTSARRSWRTARRRGHP